MSEKNKSNIDLTKIDNIEFSDIDHNDYPKYTDAYICSADHDGKEMKEEQLDELNEDYGFVHEELQSYLN